MSFELITEAINKKQYLKLYYDEHVRIVEPYCCGYHVSTGNACLSALQIGGTSLSRTKQQLPFWDMLLLDKIKHLEILNDTFDGTKGMTLGYKKNDSRISPIVAQV